MNDMNLGGHRQQGAALVIGLILLVVLTILAVSGVFTSTMELRMVAQPAEPGALVPGGGSRGRGRAREPVALDQRRVQPGRRSPCRTRRATSTRIRLQFVGQAPLGTGMTGYSIGTAFQTYHFQVDATGAIRPDNAVSNHTQSFYVVGPGT